MTLDANFLARIQFAFTASYHIIFPSISIGLAFYLVIFEGLWLKTKDIVYYNLYKFWRKIFALVFGMGVVTGLVMSMEFGANFSNFTNFVGNVLGPLIGYEVLTAFFLESTFLGIMLFGWERVGNGLHFFSTIMVCIGTTISAFWILSANSWMQTPAGYILNNGVLEPQSWMAIIFNPSFKYRFFHMLVAAYVGATFVILGISSALVKRQTVTQSARRAFKLTIGFGCFLLPLQVLLGDLHGLNTFEHQPMKIAAMEGAWETQKGAPLILFGIPNEKEEKNDYEIKIPKLSSLILTHEWEGEVKGLKEVPKEDRPPVGPVFFSFRIMVGLGFWLLLLSYVGALLIKLGKAYESRWFLFLCKLSSPLGIVATIFGWMVTEIGRQPWVVYGMMRTKEAASPSVSYAAVVTSLTSYIVVYLFITVSFLYFMRKIIIKGPHQDYQTA